MQTNPQTPLVFRFTVCCCACAVFFLLACKTDSVKGSGSDELERIALSDFESDGFTSVEIDISDISMNCDEFVADIRVLPLLHGADQLLQSVDKVLVSDTTMLVFDRRQGTVLVCDTLGQHLTILKNVGRGPQEYLSLADVVYDYDEAQIGLIKREDNAILWHGLDGAFLGKVKLDRDVFLLNRAMYLDGLLYFFYSNPQTRSDQYQLNVMDRALKQVVMSAFKTRMGAVSTSNPHSLSHYQGVPFLLLPGESAVYAVGDDSIRLAYKFDFGKQTLPDHVFTAFSDEENYRTGSDAAAANMLVKDYALVKSFVELKSFYLVGFTYQFQPVFALVEKPSSKLLGVFRPNLEGLALRQLVGADAERNKVYFEVLAEECEGLEGAGSKGNIEILEGSPWLLELRF